MTCPPISVKSLSFSSPTRLSMDLEKFHHKNWCFFGPQKKGKELLKKDFGPVKPSNFTKNPKKGKIQFFLNSILEKAAVKLQVRREKKIGLLAGFSRAFFVEVMVVMFLGP